MTSRPRVLYVAANPALRLDRPGGAGTHMRGTIDGLERSGLTVETLVGGAAAHAARPTVAQRPAPLARRISPRPVRVLARDLRLIAHARACRSTLLPPFDCVYERSSHLVDVGRPLAIRSGVPYLVETDGELVSAVAATEGIALRRYAELIERRKLRDADAVVVMSHASAAAVAGRYGVSDDKLLVKGLGVDRALVDAPPVAEERYDVGFAGTFQPYHRVELLVDAVRSLDGASALLVGDGPGRASVEAAARGLRVELPGLLEPGETMRRLASCRILVVPESSDSLYPVKVLEYAALRKPVVAPARAAFAEFVHDGEPLLRLFAPGDADDLARMLAEALAAEVDARVARFAALVADDYTWDAVGERVAARIRELVARH
jgi:glycosyltransferase involved in cell wall biosynthesis